MQPYKIFKTLEALGTIGNDPCSFKLEYHAVTIWQNRHIIQSNNYRISLFPSKYFVEYETRLLNIYAALEQLRFYDKTSFYEPKKYTML